jgi:signal recognition particle GTPase
MTSSRDLAEELDDLEFDERLLSYSIEILEARVVAMRRAARRDSSINIQERLLTQQEEDEQNRRLNRLERISDSLAQELVVARQEHRTLVSHIIQAKRNLNTGGQSGGGIPNPDLVEAFMEFRRAFSRVQRAHIGAENFFRRDSATDENLVRESLSDEIIEADAQLEIAERNLNKLQNKNITENYRMN